MTGPGSPAPGSTGERVLPYGDRALLVDTSAAADPTARARGLRGVLAGLPGVHDAVPGSRGLVLLLDGLVDEVVAGVLAALVADPRRGASGRALPGTAPGATPAVPRTDRSRLVVLEVVYDGVDLADVASVTGLGPGEVVARHAGATYTVAFLGFAPGFGYLDGLDPVLTVPRLPTPRPRVPAGAVGLAAGRTCVYPSPSPGGWRLIGRTDAVLFDAGREPPSLLAPGDQVRFRPVAP